MIRISYNIVSICPTFTNILNCCDTHFTYVLFHMANLLNRLIKIWHPENCSCRLCKSYIQNLFHLRFMPIVLIYYFLYCVWLLYQICIHCSQFCKASVIFQYQFCSLTWDRVITDENRDSLSFIDIISEPITIKFLGLGQYLVHILQA